MRTVTSDSFSHQVLNVSLKEFFFQRAQNYRPGQIDFDVYGDFWSLAFASLPEPGLKIQNLGDSFQVSGAIAILIPPHAVVRWEVLVPHLSWFAFCSRQDYSSDFPQTVSVYSLPSIPVEVSPTWVLELPQRQTPLWISRDQGLNSYAVRLKALLDQEFTDNRSLQEYAEALDISKEWLIKYFKKSYGVTPIEYRNKKRLMQAFFSLNSRHEKILDLSQDLGFNDLTHFNDLFKRNMRLTPKQLRP